MFFNLFKLINSPLYYNICKSITTSYSSNSYNCNQQSLKSTTITTSTSSSTKTATTKTSTTTKTTTTKTSTATRPNKKIINVLLSKHYVYSVISQLCLILHKNYYNINYIISDYSLVIISLLLLNQHYEQPTKSNSSVPV